jgi:YVTN family beta-propeller protein
MDLEEMMNALRGWAGVFLAACCASASFAATQATLTVGENTAGIAVDAIVHKAFVSNYATGTISVIDLDARTVKNTINVRVGVRRSGVNTALNRFYVVSDAAPGYMTVIDTKTEQIIADVQVGNNPRSFATDWQRGELYISNVNSNSISVFSTASNTVTAVIALPAQPGNISVDTNVGKIYVVQNASKAVGVYDQKTRAFIKSIPVGNNPGTVVGSEGLGRVVVNNINDKTMSVIDVTTDTVIATIPVGTGTSANFAEINSIWGKAWLPNATDGTVSVVDLTTNTVAATVSVGAVPVEAVVDSSGGDVYVVNQGSNSVTILDPATNSVTGTLPVGGSPWRTTFTRVHDYLLVLNTNGNSTTTPDTLTIADLKYTRAGTLVAVEYYHADFDHYFHSADPDEIGKLDTGLFGNNWNRTYQFWRVWTQPGTGRFPVCRFFSNGFDPKSSHFFTPYASECDGLKAGKVWQYEGTVFYVALPDVTGSCATGTFPLYRVYNNGMGAAPNHRYMVSRALRTHMVATGWVAEGSGTDIVFACLPQLQ